MRKLGLLVGVVLATLISMSAGIAVMSVDLGSEFIKVAIVKPGVPMEIVYNEESARKTSSIVAMRDGDRLFGSAAENIAKMFPRKAFWYLMHIVGKKFDDPHVDVYRKRFPYYNMIKDEDRGTVLFQIDEETTYSPEELIAMILEKARAYAEAFAGQSIKDCVITVPPYFNQAERRSILESAKMIDLNVLQLMSDNAAVALNFGVFRRKMFTNITQYYVFYDMGASSTVATVVGYQVVKMKEGTRLEANPQLVIKGVGFDKSLGGLEITLRLREHLAKLFNAQKKTTNDVFKNERSMGKLFKEAERVKKVLSANKDCFAQVEGLLDDKDFKAKVTREEMEGMVKDLFDRINKPLEDALKESEVTLPEVTEVILMGGGTRIPAVQESLMKYLGRTELGKSINTDEAIALGAVYQAAYLGKGYKVKTFAVKEATIYPIVVEFEKRKTGEDGSDSVKQIRRTLFGRMNPYPQKKVMTFNRHFTDFSFNVSYGDLDFLPEEELKSFSTFLLKSVNLTGVQDAHEKHGKEAESKGVKAHFRVDESGLLHLDQVESVFEKEDKEEESTWSKLGGTITGLFGGTSSPKDGEKQDTEKTDTPTAEVPSGSEEEETEQKEDTKEKEEPKADEPQDGEKEADTGSKEGEEKTPESDGTEKETKKEEKTDKSKEDEKKESKDAEKVEKKEDEPKKPKQVVLKENITAESIVRDLPQITKDKMKTSKKRLRDLAALDKEKKLLEKAKNELEAFIFDMTDKLSQDKYIACSTEKERESLNERLAEASDWQYEQDEDAKKEVYKDKFKSLKKAVEDLDFRVKEFEERPRALEALKGLLNHTYHFYLSIKNLTEMEDPIFTQVEIDTLSKLINDTYTWRDDMVKEQEAMSLHEKPKLLVEDVAQKMQDLDREVKYLLNKAKHYKPKTTPKPESSKNETNETVIEADSNSTDKSDPPPSDSDSSEKDGEPSKDQDSEGEKAEGGAGDTTTKSPVDTDLPIPPTADTPPTDQSEGTDEQEEVLKIDGDDSEVPPTEEPSKDTTHNPEL